MSLFCCLVIKWCLTLCDPMNCSPPGSSVHGIPQAGILEWVASSFSRGASQIGDHTCVSCTTGGFFTTEPPGKRLKCHQLSSKVKREVLLARSCQTLLSLVINTVTLCDPARPLCPWDSPGKNTGVGSHCLLQGIFPTRQILYHLSHQGSLSSTC